jgi:hypothetical protein
MSESKTADAPVNPVSTKRHALKAKQAKALAPAGPPKPAKAPIVRVISPASKIAGDWS